MAPLAWVRRIAQDIPELNTIPLFGNAPAFDWQKCSSAICSQLNISSLSIHPREQKWRDREDLNQGFGSNPLSQSIAISPIGSIFWMMSREDIAKLTSWMMSPEGEPRSISSEILQEGFYRYLLLETLNALQDLDPVQGFTLQLSEEENVADKLFCIDIEIGFEHQSCWGRLAIPSDFRTAWIQHFAQMPSEYIPTEIARQTQLILGVKIGSVLLQQEEWKTIRPGDFVLLDRGGYDSNKGAGLATLMLQSTPLFNLRIKHNQIELADYAFYYEENMTQKGGKPPEQNGQAGEGEAISLKELPLFVTVEIARLKITLDELMHLNPGNTLELPIHPDQGVSLTINGQKVGRAELVHLGEQLALRILEIG